MLTLFIVLLSFYGMAFMIKEASIFDNLRTKLIRSHPFFYGLFSCYFCVGFHAGWIVYLLSFDYFNWRTMILWGLAGAATSFLTNLVVDKLLSESSEDKG